MRPTDNNRDEEGFTLIELMYTIVIIGMLSSLSFMAYTSYRYRALYSNAEVILRNSRIAFTAFEGDSGGPGQFNVGITFSPGDGNLPADIESFLPTLSVNEGVRIGAQYNYCNDASPPLGVNVQVISQPCKGASYTTWTKFCGGLEVVQKKVFQAADAC